MCMAVRFGSRQQVGRFKFPHCSQSLTLSDFHIKTQIFDLFFLFCGIYCYIVSLSFYKPFIPPQHHCLGVPK